MLLMQVSIQSSSVFWIKIPVFVSLHEAEKPVSGLWQLFNMSINIIIILTAFSFSLIFSFMELSHSSAETFLQEPLILPLHIDDCLHRFHWSVPPKIIVRLIHFPLDYTSFFLIFWSETFYLYCNFDRFLLLFSMVLS